MILRAVITTRTFRKCKIEALGFPNGPVHNISEMFRPRSVRQVYLCNAYISAVTGIYFYFLLIELNGTNIFARLFLSAKDESRTSQSCCLWGNYKLLSEHLNCFV